MGLTNATTSPSLSCEGGTSCLYFMSDAFVDDESCFSNVGLRREAD